MYNNVLNKNFRHLRRFYLTAGLVLLGLGLMLPAAAQAVTADVVAMDQVLVYNRMGAINPAGMIFALARDLELIDTDAGFLSVEGEFVDPLTPCTVDGSIPSEAPTEAECQASDIGNVQLRDDKRPRPLTLRVNEGEQLEINFKNLLSPSPITDAMNEAPGIGIPAPIQSEQPATRNVGIHVHGMKPTNIGDDGSNVGNNGSSLVAPGGSTTYRLTAGREGAYAITSGPNLGGQGGSGAIANGLFGVLNVEPADSTWYRSQVTREEMDWAASAWTTTDGGSTWSPSIGNAPQAAIRTTLDGQPILNYNAVYPAGHPYDGKPILKILDDSAIFHNELNAVITPGSGGFNDPAPYQLYPNRGEPFREFTVAFHDEIKVVQAFPQWYTDLNFTLSSVKDGFAINYGSGGIGSEIIANRLGKGPMKDCVECKYEEFFLTSWVVGDPAMIVDVPATMSDPAGNIATKAFYPDDPSNVWHGYLNDRTKIRNIHVGTEHHIFHLHAHQWNFINNDNEGDQSNYLDAQALGPGSSFTYEITYGGGGNRNKTPGDSIFHCHFYPHFAQGMWGLWRVHDVFEMGTELDADGRPAAGSRALPDGEIAAGTPIPGVVPLPTKTMAPMPELDVAIANGEAVLAGTTMLLRDATQAQIDDNKKSGTAGNPGYPFFIPGVAGHRPPSPPLDLVADGGLPRHVIDGGVGPTPVHQVQTATDFDKVLLSVSGFQLPETGTAVEEAAMAFHGPQTTTGLGPVYHDSYFPDGTVAAGHLGFEINGLPPIEGAPYAEPCRSDTYDGGPKGALVDDNYRFYAASVIELDVDLNKVGWHFGQQRIIVLDEDVAATIAGTRAPEPFVMRANSGDCVDFNHTNLVPNVYQLDDFQVKTPTDVIGQHIHLVKFDVTSSDGSANGWNYEDGTLSPDEVTERIHALKAGLWTPLDPTSTLPEDGGPRTTRQRWYIDPGWSGNVFTHDHFGPSTHQQAGLYGTLLIEPRDSQWLDPTDGTPYGTRADGGPTSWRADIIDGADAYREFYLEFADFQLAYRGQDDGGALNRAGTPVNPSDRIETGLPFVLKPAPNPRPEAISAADPGTFVVNMRNEPLALRVRDPNTNTQALTVDTDGDGLPNPEAGDLSYAFSSDVVRADERLNGPVTSWPYGLQTATQGALPGDPFTPILRAYEGDKVSVRVQVGAHEEGHNFSMNGIRWLQNWRSGVSGFRNSQMAGISEYFIFQVPGLGGVTTGPFEDYLYQTGSSTDARWNGSWGIMRAYDGSQGLQPDLLPLPTNPDGKVPPVGGKGGKPPFQGPCPRDADERKFDLIAVRGADVLPDLDGDGLGDLVYNNTLGDELWDPTAMLYLKKSDLDKNGKLKADRRVEPLILRAAAGECISITLTNQLGGEPLDFDGFNSLPMIVNEFNGNQIAPSSEVGLHAQLVEYDMSFSDGMNVGFNPVGSVGFGETTTYKWYAGKIDISPGTPGNRTATPIEYGAINLSASDPIEGSSKGLIGALIIEPAGATWNDGSVTGKGKDKVTKPDGDVGTDGLLTRAAIDINDAEGNLLFRDFVVIHQDDVNGWYQGAPLPTVAHEEEPEDSGMKGINYRTDPIWHRLGIGPTTVGTRTVDYTDAFAGDPQTPIYTAGVGEAIRLRILKPGGHNRNSTPTLHGFVWARYPYSNDDGVYGNFDDSQYIDPGNENTFWHGEQMGHGPSNHINVVPLAPAGPAGDYLYRDMVPVHVDNGEWAIVRVE